MEKEITELYEKLDMMEEKLRIAEAMLDELEEQVYQQGLKNGREQALDGRYETRSDIRDSYY